MLSIGLNSVICVREHIYALSTTFLSKNHIWGRIAGGEQPDNSTNIRKYFHIYESNKGEKDEENHDDWSRREQIIAVAQI